MERHVLERLDGRRISLRTPGVPDLPRKRCNISNPSQEVSGAPIVAEAEPRLGESSLSKGDHLRGRERVDDG